MIKKCAVFLMISFSVIAQAQNADIDLLKKINGSYTETGGKVMRFMSNSDTPIALGLPAGLWIAGKINNDNEMVLNSYESFSTQLLNGVVTTVLKISIQRDRPFVTYPNDIQKHSVAGSYSFPSGHTSMAFATATSISLQYPKWYIIAPAYLWATSVGFSRMYLGVHYPTDVLFGALIGTGSSLLTHYTFTCLKRKWALRDEEKKL